MIVAVEGDVQLLTDSSPLIVWKFGSAVSRVTRPVDCGDIMGDKFQCNLVNWIVVTVWGSARVVGSNRRWCLIVVVVVVVEREMQFLLGTSSTYEVAVLRHPKPKLNSKISTTIRPVELPPIHSLCKNAFYALRQCNLQ
jgi:hypothetical protein